MKISTEIFFRRNETAREQLTFPAPLFNRCLLLLNHSPTANVFVPLRNMQLQAVIDREEIVFVDNHDYAVKDGEGGRLIVLVWVMALHSARDTLNEPVPIEVVYYGAERHEIHRRLMSELSGSLDNYEARLKQHIALDKAATILPFRQ